jgi:hypothetical protein
MRRLFDLVRNVVRHSPAAPSIVCSSCGEAAVEGVGDPRVERLCVACAVMLQVRCSEGDPAACARLEALNAQAR